MERVSFINGIEQTLYLYVVVGNYTGNQVIGYQLNPGNKPVELPSTVASSILMVTFYLNDSPVTYFNSLNFAFMPGGYTIIINNLGLMEFQGTGNTIAFQPVSGDIALPS